MRGAQNGDRCVLDVHDLAHTFRTGLAGRVRALDGVTFAVEAGEMVGVLGPNGSGKTTLLDHLLGLRRPHRGRARVFGLDPGHRSALARIGYLPQSPLPYPRLSGEALLRFLARARGLDRRQAARCAGEMLERLALGAAAARPIGGYSTGMERRISLAAALLHRPDLLLLDEPTAGLDPEGSRIVRGMLAEEAARGATLLMASHHLHEVERVCGRVLLLVEGRVAADGALEDLLAAPGQRMLVVRGLSQEGLSAVRAAVRGHGGEVVREGPAPLPLEEVYRGATGAPPLPGEAG